MNFDNLITTFESIVMDFSKIQGPPKLALYFCFAICFVCFLTLKKTWFPRGKIGAERIYKRWRDSELIDIYDAFNHVTHGLWCDWKRVKLKEKQMQGFDGRIIKAHGQFFEYAFRVSGSRIIVCSNYKCDKVYRY